MRMTRRWAVAVAVAVLATMGAPARSGAAFLTYTQTATASGTLGGVAFVDAVITFTQTADTAAIIGAPGPFRVANLSSTVTIEGLGLANFTTPTSTFNFGTHAGVGRTSDTRVILASFNPPALIGYDLSGPIGPVTGSALSDPTTSFATDRGLLVLSSARIATFQARATIAAVPEPSSLALAGLASAVGLGARALRRRRGGGDRR